MLTTVISQLNKSVALSLNPMASMSVVLSQSMTDRHRRTHIHMLSLLL